jgi:hypothetical protein
MLVMRAKPLRSLAILPHGRAARTIAFILAIAVLSGLLASSQTKPGPKPQRRLVAAVDKTLADGKDAVLPPHISNLLGISPQEREVPVKQFVIMGEVVKGFDVDIADHHHIVIFVEDRSKKENMFYLTSPLGTLQKALSVREGVGYIRMPTAPDQKAFATEKSFWLDRITPEHK